MLYTGRKRPVQGEQAGEGGHPGDDGAVPETEGDAARGRLRGRVQAVHGTGAGTYGGTVDRRTAATVGPAHGRTPGDVRATAAEDATAAAADGQLQTVFGVLRQSFFRRTALRRAGEEQQQLLVFVVRVLQLVGRRLLQRVRVVFGTPQTFSGKRSRGPYDRASKHGSAQAHVEALVKGRHFFFWGGG